MKHSWNRWASNVLVEGNRLRADRRGYVCSFFYWFYIWFFIMGFIYERDEEMRKAALIRWDAHNYIRKKFQQKILRLL